MASITDLATQIEQLEGQIEYHITRPWLCLTAQARIIELIEEQDNLILELNRLRSEQSLILGNDPSIWAS